VTPLVLITGSRCHGSASACGCIELEGNELTLENLPPLHEGCDCAVQAVLDHDGWIFRTVHRGEVEVVVEPLIWGQSRLCVGDAGKASYRDVWDYQSPIRAVQAAMIWDPFEDKEPEGWHRHVGSGRRRIDGDPNRETVRQ